MQLQWPMEILELCFFNRGPTTMNITVNWSDIGLDAGVGATVRDLWAHATIGVFSDSFSLSTNTHGSRTVRVIPLQAATTATTTTITSTTTTTTTTAPKRHARGN